MGVNRIADLSPFIQRTFFISYTLSVVDVVTSAHMVEDKHQRQRNLERGRPVKWKRITLKSSLQVTTLGPQVQHIISH